MSQPTRLILTIAALSVSLVLSACFNSGESDSGVARIDESGTSGAIAEAAVQPDRSERSASGMGTSPAETNTDELTDEEITTIFITCLRDHGFDVPDPELNADGTVNFSAMRQAIANDPDFNPESEKTAKAFEECIPLLRGATFARNPSPEDEIELQDNLLKFSQCLRDNEIDASDPDFSGGPRAAFGSVLEGIDAQDDKVREVISSCSEQIFGGGTGSGGGRR